MMKEMYILLMSSYLFQKVRILLYLTHNFLSHPKSVLVQIYLDVSNRLGSDDMRVDLLGLLCPISKMYHMKKPLTLSLKSFSYNNNNIFQNSDLYLWNRESVKLNIAHCFVWDTRWSNVGVSL